VAGVTVDRVSKSYGGVAALHEVSLELVDGEFLVLVGPSGCGKTTLLRTIAGLESATSGRILIGDLDVTALPPKQRDVAMVFQDYALYPHLTVEQNLGLGLKLRKIPRDERKRRVRSVAEMLGLQDMLRRKPTQLSGGQQQRVAIGRAIVREPVVYLLDEPLSNLDAQLRARTRAELARLRDRLRVTTVYVTHDQVEAMTLGDRVAVLRDGALQQVATPQTLFNKPANVFVAGFIGSPEMNLVHAEHVAGTVRFGGHVLPVRDDAGVPPGRVIVGIRASKFSLLEGPVRPARGGRISVTADVVELLGEELRVMFGVDAPSAASFTPAGDTDAQDSAPRTTSTFIASLPSGARIAPGDRLELAVDTDALHFFDSETGLAIARRASPDLEGRSLRITSTVTERAVQGARSM
jgi:multiple sugar transport system ATP-binding protein